MLASAKQYQHLNAFVKELKIIQAFVGKVTGAKIIWRQSLRRDGTEVDE